MRRWHLVVVSPSCKGVSCFDLPFVTLVCCQGLPDNNGALETNRVLGLNCKHGKCTMGARDFGRLQGEASLSLVLSALYPTTWPLRYWLLDCNWSLENADTWHGAAVDFVTP